MMQQRSVEYARRTTKSKVTCLEIKVNPKFTRNKVSKLEFIYTNIIDIACGLLTNQHLVKSDEDLLWGTSVQLDENTGERLFTPDLNTGHWWERTEKMITGGPASGLTLLPFMVFIDETQTVARGSQSAKPITVTIGNFKERIRQKQVNAY